MKATENVGEKDLSAYLYDDIECPFDNSQSQAQSGQQKLTVQQESIFSSSKLQLYSKNIQSHQKLNYNIYEEGTQFTAKVDIQCVLEGRAQNHLFDLRESIENGKSSYGTEFVNFSLISDMTHEDLELVLHESPCILGLGSSHKYSHSSLSFNDREITEQVDYLNAIKAFQMFALMNEHKYPYSDFPKKVVVAVIDTGVDYSHEDLKQNILKKPSGEYHGYNAIDGQDTSDFMDYGYHGTHVSGIIAAHSNNGLGVLGLSPINTYIMPIKVRSNGNLGGSTVEVARGIQYAAENGAHIINLSLGAPRFGASIDAIIYDEIQKAISKGVFVVASVGNIVPTEENYSREVSLSGYHYMPASFSSDFEGMVSVGSINAKDMTLSSFSHYSSEILDIVAPGSIDDNVGIYSTIPIDNMQKPGQYYFDLQGTSMSAPMVSAAAAIIMNVAIQKKVPVSPSQIQSLVLKSSDHNSNLSPYVVNGRVLNLNRIFQTAFKCL